jgi:tetratricopeptide (TPR) repeat protein
MLKTGVKRIIPWFLLFISFVSYSQSLYVDYIEGDVDVRTKGLWTPVSIGDELLIASSLRLKEGSFIELISGKERISIFEKGTYKLKDIVDTSKEVSSWGMASLFEIKMKAVFAKDENIRGSEAQAGVRGPDESESLEEQVEFFDIEDDNQFIKDGLEFIEKGNYKAALSEFLEGFEKAAGDEEAITFRYYIAYTYSEMEIKARALKYLNEVEVPEEHPFLRDIILLRGRLLIEGMAFHEALNLLTVYLSRYPEGEFAQALLILSSYCYRGLGDTTKARENLTSAVTIDPATEIGKEAEKILGSL